MLYILNMFLCARMCLCFIVLSVVMFVSGVLTESCTETCSSQYFECVGKVAVHYDDDERLWCCQVTLMPAGHYFTGCRANGVVWNTTCPFGFYQSSQTLSVESRSCMQHFECRYPETATAVAGNSVNNTVCVCNANLGYVARNSSKRSGLLNPVDCILSPSTTLSTDKYDSHSGNSPTNHSRIPSGYQHDKSIAGLVIFVLIALLLIVGAVFVIQCLPYHSHCTSVATQQSCPTSAELNEVVDRLRGSGSAME